MIDNKDANNVLKDTYDGRLWKSAHAYQPRTEEQTGRAEVQGHPQLPNDSKDNLGYTRACFKNIKQKREVEAKSISTARVLHLEFLF